MGVDIGHRLWSATPALSWYALRWPKELDAKLLHAWLQALGGNKASRGVRFVIVAEASGIHHYLAIPEGHDQAIRNGLASFLPEIEVAECEPVTLMADRASQLRMTSKERSLSDFAEITNNAVLSSLQGLSHNERVTVSLLLGSCKAPVAIPGDITAFRSSTLAGNTAEAFMGRTPEKLDTTALHSMREKYAASSWDAALYVGVRCTSDSRYKYLVQQIVGGFNTGDAAGVRLGAKSINTKRLSATYTPLRWPLRFNVDELASFLSWPLGDRKIAGIQRIRYRRVPLPANAPQKGLELGDSVLSSDSRPVVIPTIDRMTHIEVDGPSGTGKSTLEENCIIQDLASGRGLVHIDFKGDGFRHVLARVPHNRIDDIVAINLSNIDRVIGINPLAHPSNPNQVADDIISIFVKLFGEAIGPRTKSILLTGLLTLMQVPGSSIISLPALLTDDEFRHDLLSKVLDVYLLHAWSVHERRSTAEKNAAILPLLNKLDPLLLRPAIRRTLGQSHPKFDLSEVFTKKKVLLVNLSEATIGADGAAVVGAFFMSMLLDRMRQQSNVPEEMRPIVPFYIDESQVYWRQRDDFTKALETFRSNKIPIFFTHQHRGQLSKDDREGLVNARTTICFQQGHEDATYYAKSSTVLTPQDFESLPPYHAYARLTINNQVMPWVSLQTRPLPEPTCNPDSILTRSRELYGTQAAEIEQELQAYYAVGETVKGDEATAPAPLPVVDFAIGHRTATDLEQLDITYQQRLQHGDI